MTSSLLPRRLREAPAAWRAYVWPAVVTLAALWPVAGVFTWSRVFVQRDLMLYFWPKYRWLRETVYAGQWPLWDPYMGGGSSAVGDALNQFFLLPTLALRLLLPEPIGFNLWIALPIPLAAWGAYLFFRRHGSQAAAALGAIVFAVGGPLVSTGNFPNLSWSILFLPWLFWAGDRCAERLTARRLAVVALFCGAQACAGEPVTFATTSVLLIAYAAVASPRATPGMRAWLALVGGLGVALTLGTALAAVQLLPLQDVVKHSNRWQFSDNATFWSLHPLMLFETIAPNLFGNYFATFVTHQPWMQRLNSGRDPFFYSLYLGVAPWLLAIVGLRASGQARFRAFWALAAVGGVLGALGEYTPVYPLAVKWLPLVGSFRFPAKYFLFVSFAIAALATVGWSALERWLGATVEQPDRNKETEATPGTQWAQDALRPSLVRVRRPGGRWLVAGLGLGLAVTAYAIAAWIFLAPDSAAWGWFGFARFIGLARPADGAAFVMAEWPSQATRVLLLALAAAGLLVVALSSRVEARRAAWVFYGMIVVDLAVTNGVINPTVDRAMLDPPDWVKVVQQHPHERFYYGGRLDGLVLSDLEPPLVMTLPGNAGNLLEMRVIASNGVVTTSSEAGIRELIGLDLPGTRTREYTRMHALFLEAPGDARRVFLRRAGVRYCVEPASTQPQGAVLARVPNVADAALVECNPDARRVAVVPRAHVVASLEQQAQQLLRPHEDGEQLLMLKTAPPEAAGTPGTPVEPFARFTRDDGNVVQVKAGASADGGYLVLRDTYDESWRVDVDGRPAEIQRGNLFFRAVRLTPGEHVVTFTYVPASLRNGALISAVAALGILAMLSWRPRPLRASDPAPARTMLSPVDEPAVRL